ncbi:MAG: DUF6029 family protein [Candidatus Marinimicrobia bacterium]|nr:DUF6029 family protein [Candidatus Neomarinimicrobiota bacterium]
MKRVILLLSFSMVCAQVSFTGNTETRIGESRTGFYYNETMINTHLQYGDFINWLQFEFSDPPELGRSLNGLRKLRLEYDRGNLSLKLGDLYEIWGRGIILNSIDDQPIDRDTGIRGLSIHYNADPLEMHFITGKATFAQSTIYVPGFNNRYHNYSTSYNLYGVDFNYILGNHFLGASFLQSKEDHPIAFADTLDLKNQLLSTHYTYSNTIYDFYLEYIMNRSFEFNNEDEYYQEHTDGRGFYGNLNLYLDLFSLNIEYINYQFGTLDPLNRWDPVSNYGLFQPYQNPPIAMNIHENVLMNRITHQFDFNNEVGYKFEIMGMLTDWIDFFGVYSASSRSISWVRSSEDFSWQKAGASSYLPNTDKSAMPFRDIYGELSFDLLNGQLYVKTGYGDSYDVTDLTTYIKTDTSSSMYYMLTSGQTIPLYMGYSLGGGWNIHAKIETQFLKKGFSRIETLNGETVIDTFYSDFYNDLNENGVPDNDEFLDFETNHFMSISIGKSPHWSATVTLDRTNISETVINDSHHLNPLEEFLGIDQTKNWVNLEIIYNVTNSMRLSLLYGSLKGGLICTNGVCRIIEPFDDGFKLGLTTVF